MFLFLFFLLEHAGDLHIVSLIR